MLLSRRTTFISSDYFVRFKARKLIQILIAETVKEAAMLLKFQPI